MAFSNACLLKISLVVIPALMSSTTAAPDLTA